MTAFTPCAITLELKLKFHFPTSSICVCILQMIKYWRWEQPGNEASHLQLKKLFINVNSSVACHHELKAGNRIYSIFGLDEKYELSCCRQYLSIREKHANLVKQKCVSRNNSLGIVVECVSAWLVWNVLTILLHIKSCGKVHLWPSSQTAYAVIPIQGIQLCSQGFPNTCRFDWLQMFIFVTDVYMWEVMETIAFSHFYKQG